MPACGLDQDLELNYAKWHGQGRVFYVDEYFLNLEHSEMSPKFFGIEEPTTKNSSCIFVNALENVLEK
jgi:hypothetical protein